MLLTVIMTVTVIRIITTALQFTARRFTILDLVVTWEGMNLIPGARVQPIHYMVTARTRKNRKKENIISNLHLI